MPDAGDLVWLDFDPQLGHEQAGFRPALILSSRYFNLRTSLAFACPISSKVKGYQFQVELPAGLPVHGAVLCEHLRSLDWRARKANCFGRLPDDLLVQVRGVVRTITGMTR
ncbi:MAG: type II toxin-antitoxin system PemK/MazF family toxin [Acidobacteriota bacterium]